MRGGAGGRGQRVGGRSQRHGQMKKPHHLTYVTNVIMSSTCMITMTPNLAREVKII